MPDKLAVFEALIGEPVRDQPQLLNLYSQSFHAKNMLGQATTALRRPHVRRQVTSSIFMATFVGSIVTVFLSSSSSPTGGLPCPARKGKGHADDEAEVTKGERVALSGRRGFIQVEDYHRGGNKRAT